MQLKHLDHLNLGVSDLGASLDFYARVFGMEKVEAGEKDGVAWAIVRGGEAMLCLYEHAGHHLPTDTEREATGQLGLNHFGLRITDREAWEQVIAREKLTVNYGGPVGWPHSTAWYIYDPSGYEIEVALWEGDEIRF